MWEAVFLLAIILLVTVHVLLRKVSRRVNDSLMVASGIGLILLVVLAPGAETWHRYGLLAIGLFSMLRGTWRMWEARTARQTS